MLLVPYPFASIAILSIVSPSPRFLSTLYAFLFGLRAVYSFACFASQTQGLCSAFPLSPFEFVRFCLSRIVLRSSSRKHRVCAMLFPRSPLKFVRLCLSYYVMRTSPHKHRVYAVFFPWFPFKFVRLCVSFRYAYFASQTSGLCSACTSVPFRILHACVFMFCVLRLANTGFVQCFPSALFEFVRLCLSCFVMRTLPHKNRVCALLFSRLPFKFTRLYWSWFVVRVFRFTWFWGIRLISAGFVVVAGCFYSPGSA